MTGIILSLMLPILILSEIPPCPPPLDSCECDRVDWEDRVNQSVVRCTGNSYDLQSFDILEHLPSETQVNICLMPDDAILYC